MTFIVIGYSVNLNLFLLNFGSLELHSGVIAMQK